LGDGRELRIVEGESNKSSGEFLKSKGSMSVGMSRLAGAGDVVATDASSCIGDVADCTEPSAVLFAAAGVSFGEEYRHSLSDLLHVAQRGRSSSHLTLRRLQVRLSGSADVCTDLMRASGVSCDGSWQ